jgi:hypothetical protein
MTEPMAVIVPTRGRPNNMRRLMEAWAETEATAKLVFAVDSDDPTFRQHRPELDAAVKRLGLDTQVEVWETDSSCMNEALNETATTIAPAYDVLGFMGDDHVPRTLHWDEMIMSRGAGADPWMAYGNDLFQAANLPTAVFMTSSIVKTLGFMAPPVLRHLFLDNTWIEWGRALGGLRYYGDIIIEHMHPQAGKAEWDEGHLRVNGSESWDHDSAAWSEYLKRDLHVDLAKLRLLV